MFPVVYQDANSECLYIGFSHAGNFDDIFDVFGRRANQSEVLTPAPLDLDGMNGTIIEPITITTERERIDLQAETVVTVVSLTTDNEKVMAACLVSIAGRLHRFVLPIDQIRTESIF
jgi:hypothetical protein